MYEHAIQYDPWPEIFTYIQGYFYIISYMLIPSKYAVLIIEVGIYILTLGYTLRRLKNIILFAPHAYLYVLISIPLILTTLTFIPHRLPIYTPIYILLFTRLFFDKIEDQTISKPELFLLLITAALLSQWRVEGLYLIFLFPLLTFLIYKNIRGKILVRTIICFLVVVLAIALIQYMSVLSNKSNYFKWRSSPVYTWTISTMILNGLDENKNAEDLAVINKYMSIETVHKMNAEMGEESYADEFIFFKYHGLNLDADEQTVSAFIRSSQNIIKNNPGCFIISRINAFKFLAKPQLYRSKILNLSVNMYLPVITCLIAFFITLFRRKWFLMLIISAPLIQMFITLLLLPAAYFKYFYIPFFAGWQIIMISAILFFDKYVIKLREQKRCYGHCM